MIEGIGIWIRTIVTVIFLATMLEMFLPGGTMQKYVRVVMGLLLLLVILNPLINLAGKDYSWQARIWEVGNEQGLQAVLAAGEQLRVEQEKYALQEYKNRLAEQVTRVVNRIPGIKKVRAEVIIVEDAKSKDYGRVMGLTLWVTPGRPEVEGSVHIEPVKPVKIGIQEPLPAEKTAALPEELTREVISLLSRELSIEPSQVTLFGEQGE